MVCALRNTALPNVCTPLRAYSTRGVRSCRKGSSFDACDTTHTCGLQNRCKRTKYTTCFCETGLGDDRWIILSVAFFAFLCAFSSDDRSFFDFSFLWDACFTECVIDDGAIWVQRRLPHLNGAVWRKIGLAFAKKYKKKKDERHGAVAWGIVPLCSTVPRLLILSWKAAA